MLENFLSRVARASSRLSFRHFSRLSVSKAVGEIRRPLSPEAIQKHYYSPIPDADDFAPGFWDRTSELIGVRINENQAIKLLREVFPPYLAEFRSQFPINRPSNGAGFFLINGVYMAVDAHVYYCLIRYIKPKRIIEIGAGQSTILAVAAAKVNAERDGTVCAITAIEPYPSPELEDKASEGEIDLIVRKVQDVELDLFRTLQSKDFLFIDSSHVLREGNDVQLEYLEILPRLNPGVFVHVHDISLPRKYPKVYFDNNVFWNEQYLLHAYLINNNKVDIFWPGNYLMLKHPGLMLETFPEFRTMRQHFPMSEPSAFWMMITDGTQRHEYTVESDCAWSKR